MIVGAFILKRWDVLVNGHAPCVFEASSIGRARSKAWRAFQNADDTCTFKRFMGISTLRRNDDTPAHYGEPITVGDEPAFFVGYAGGNSLRFVRGGSDTVMTSHLLDTTVTWDKTDDSISK